MSSATKERSLGIAQIIVIIVAVVALFLAWDFGRRIVDTLSLAQAEARTDQQLRDAQDTNVKLKDLKTSINTESWVEKYVRTNWHWTRENETIFVPAATPIPSPTPVPKIPAPATPPPKPFWEEWLDALFGPAP